MTYLWVVFLALNLTDDMMTSLFLSTYGVQQSRASSSSIFLALANSAISVVFDSFKSLSGAHVVD